MLTNGPVLHTLWINDFADLTDYRAFPFMSELSRSLRKDGDRRKYGDGRLRSYSRAGITHDWQVSFATCSPEDLAWLEEHIDRTVVVRDDRGHRIFAVYYDIEVQENSWNDEGASGLSLLEVSASLEV